MSLIEAPEGAAAPPAAPDPDPTPSANRGARQWPRLTVIVVSYNTRELTLASLRSLFATVPRPCFELLVVDNASHDGSADAVAAEFPSATLIRLDDNIGFAAANNLASAQARGEYLLLLNPDTEVYEGAIQNLLAFAESHPAAGIWGGRTVFPDGSLNPASCWNRITPHSALFSAVGLSALFPASRFFNPEAIGGWARDSVREVDIVVGCFLMIRRTLWEELGGFDLAFFMYGEEADLCLRARRLGYRPMITPDATIMHLVGAATRKKAEKVVLVAKAKTTLIRRHWHPAIVPVGVSLMWLWGAVRVAASEAMSLRPGERSLARQDHWRHVWQRRSSWLAGY